MPTKHTKHTKGTKLLWIWAIAVASGVATLPAAQLWITNSGPTADPAKVFTDKINTNFQEVFLAMGTNNAALTNRLRTDYTNAQTVIGPVIITGGDSETQGLNVRNQAAFGQLVVTADAQLNALLLTQEGLSYAATVNLNFTNNASKRLALGGDVTFTTTAPGFGRMVVVRITGDGTARSLTFPAWKFAGVKPTKLGTNRVGTLLLQGYGTTDGEVVATWQEEAMAPGNVLYVSVNGEDATAVRGDPLHPWRSISNAVWLAQNGDTVLIGSGTFTNKAHIADLVDVAAINVFSKTNVTITGSGWGTVIYTTNVGDAFCLSNCLNVKIENLHIKGTYSLIDAEVPDVLIAAIGMDQCNGMTVQDCFIEDSPGHGILMYVSGETLGSTNSNRIINNYIKRTGNWVGAQSRYDGGGIVPAGRCLVAGNYLEDCAYGIEPFPPMTGSTNNIERDGMEIVNNLIFNTLHHGIQVGGNTNTVYALIANNYIANLPNYRRQPENSNMIAGAVAIHWSPGPQGPQMRGNVLRGFNGGGIQVLTDSRGMRDLVIEENSIFDMTNELSTGGIQVQDNDGSFSGARGASIRNNLTSKTSTSGIIIHGTDSTVENNTVLDPSWSGFGVPGIDVITVGSSGSSNVTVRNNNVLDRRAAPNMGIGVRGAAGTKEIHILGNTVGGQTGATTPIDLRGTGTFEHELAPRMTTDGTVTTVLTVTPPPFTAIFAEFKATARATNAAALGQAAAYVTLHCLTNGATAAGAVGTISRPQAQESVAGWDADIAASGATVLYRITGAASTTNKWNMKVSGRVVQ